MWWASWSAAFAVTLAIESPIYVWLLRPWCRWPAALGLAVGVNLVTHPLLWFGFRAGHFAGGGYAAAFVVTELLAWSVEWWVLSVALRRRDAARSELAAVAGLANLYSAAVGLVGALMA
jgi:hypothetical protein